MFQSIKMNFHRVLEKTKNANKTNYNVKTSKLNIHDEERIEYER